MKTTSPSRPPRLVLATANFRSVTSSYWSILSSYASQWSILFIPISHWSVSGGREEGQEQEVDQADQEQARHQPPARLQRPGPGGQQGRAGHAPVKTGSGSVHLYSQNRSYKVKIVKQMLWVSNFIQARVFYEKFGCYRTCTVPALDNLFYPFFADTCCYYQETRNNQ